MKVALIGATGFVGTAVLNELLQRGHQVTAIVRNPEKVKQNQNVKAVKANVLDAKEVVEVVKNHDAVISSYNPGWTNPDLYNEFMIGAKSIQEGVKKSKVQRLIVVGGAGSLYIAEGLQLVDSAEFPAMWKPGALGARDYLNFIKGEKQLDWTFLSPAVEMHKGTSGERKGHYRTGLDTPVFDAKGKSIISVEDTAQAIVDELENPKHLRMRFTIAY